MVLPRFATFCDVSETRISLGHHVEHVEHDEVSGVLFLGQDLEGFSTPEHAFRSSLLAVLGHWDWHVLEEIGHLRSAFWLWVFSIVLSLISLNMLLVT